MFRAVASSPPAQVSSPDHAGLHFYSSSGGNAGLACATSAAALGRPATIVVPLPTPAHMVAKLQALGAEVILAGRDWPAADAYLRAHFLAGAPGSSNSSGGGASAAAAAVYVPPFDHPDIWAGAASLVEELAPHFPPGAADAAGRLHGIVCSVGGGGLLCGVMEGVGRVYGGRSGEGEGGAAPPPRVLAVETAGADSLHASVRAGELVTLAAITSVATSLGARRVAGRALEWALRPGGGVVSAVVSDADAVAAVARFLDEARFLVEPACGATIAPVYNGDLRRYLGEGLSDGEWATRNVVLVVCGGSNISLEMLVGYQQRFGV